MLCGFFPHTHKSKFLILVINAINSCFEKLIQVSLKGPGSHTHSRRGLFSPIYLMSKAISLVALNCSRWCSKKYTLLT